MKDSKSKALHKKMGKKDRIAHEYGGMTSSGEYIHPNTKAFKEKYHPRGFKSGMREINRLKRQGK